MKSSRGSKPASKGDRANELFTSQGTMNANNESTEEGLILEARRGARAAQPFRVSRKT